MAAHRQAFWVGVDLGGTKILAGVFDARLRLMATAKVRTKADCGKKAVIERIARCVRQALDGCGLDLTQVRGVGVGAPGAVDSQTGRVIFAPNLPGWKDVPLKNKLEKLLDVPVFVGNDANVATLGVFQKEYDARPRHLVGIFIGTGIGGGLILNGELFYGHNLTAGEVGHMVVDAAGPPCGCGNRGCFEALASRTAIFRKIAAAARAGRKTVMCDEAGKDLPKMRSSDLRKAIEAGDRVAKQAVGEAAAYAGIGVANLINLLNPEIVVVGGGLIAALGEFIMPTLVRTAMKHIMPGTAQGISIRASKLGDHAGITGAAVLAQRGSA